MNDFIKILLYEKNTLMKGWLIASLIILPFTFIPTYVIYGLTLESIQHRLPYSILYSLGFALFVISIALLQNYQHLARRKRVFDKPAFTALNFYGRLDGVGSIIKELETFLIGKVGDYYFRLNIIHPESNQHTIEIVPLIKTKTNKDLVYLLKSQYGFRYQSFFGKEVHLSDELLEDKQTIRKILLDIESILKKQDAKPLALNETELEG